MSSPENLPNIGTSLVLVHRVITRALHVAADNARFYAKEGLPDRSVWNGFIEYVHCMLTYLHTHHVLEDEIAFPMFRQLLPDAPYEELYDQHRRIATLIEDARKTLAGLETDPADTRLFERMRHLLLHIDSQWHPHISQEELHFNLETIAATLSPQMEIDAARSFAKFASEANQPDYLLIPFALYNLVPEDRIVMQAGLPDIVTQQLLPVVWKGKWEHMQPFLLN